MDLMLAGEQLRGPPYTWLIHCARRQLPSVTRFQVPDQDALKQAFTYALRQNWAGPNVLALVDRCNKAGEHRMWCTVWIGSLLKLSTADEIGAATELCLSVAMLTPRRALVTFVKLVADYVLDGGNELFCVPPRGVILAQFLVQALLLAVHVQMMRSKSDGVLEDGPTKAKKSRVEHGDKDAGSLFLCSFASVTFRFAVDKATTSARCEETKEPTITGEDAVSKPSYLFVLSAVMTVVVCRGAVYSILASDCRRRAETGRFVRGQLPTLSVRTEIAGRQTHHFAFTSFTGSCVAVLLC
jgi:hypothetical protein